MSSLKDYTVEALVSTVDHLGFVTYKVNDLLIEKVDEVSEMEVRVSSAEQRIRTCRDFIDRQGRSQQSLVIKVPKYHKHYVLHGKNILASGILPTSKCQQRPNPSDLVGKSAVSPPINRPATLRNTRSPSPSRSGMRRSRSLSPSEKALSSSPSPQIEDRSLKINGSVNTGKTEGTPLPLPTPLPRTTSLASGHAFPNSSNIVRWYSLESQNSVHLHPERRRDEKVTGRSSSKSKGFLKLLLTRPRRRWKNDESLYSYLDEY